MAELDQNGQEYAAVLRKTHSTHEQALCALEAERARLLGKMDPIHDVTEIVDDRFDLVHVQGQSYRRYIVKEV